MKIDEYLRRRYGGQAGAKIERRVADKLGIPFPISPGWYSKHKDRDIPEWLLVELRAIPKKKHGRLPIPKKYVDCKSHKDFYASSQWAAVRYKALTMHGATCQCCGASRKNGEVMHVDHIKPRSKHPHLALDLSNLQVLCSSCNVGKSNVDATDWR